MISYGGELADPRPLPEIPLFELPNPGPASAGFPYYLLQLFRWTISLSGKNVLAQLGHASNAFSL